MIKIIVKFKTIIIMLVNTEVLYIASNLKYSIPKEVPVKFFRSFFIMERTNINHFAIKELIFESLRANLVV